MWVTNDCDPTSLLAKETATPVDIIGTLSAVDVPEKGRMLLHPLSPGNVLRLPEWEVEVLEMYWGDEAMLHDPLAVVSSEPALDAIYLYSGGDTTGWIVQQMPRQSLASLLVFTPLDDYSQSQSRYITLRQQGR